MGGINSKRPHHIGIQARTSIIHGDANINFYTAQGAYGNHKAIGSVCVPPENRNFVGRKNELRKITDIFNHSNYAVVEGMAGTGKTSIAVQYLFNYCSGYENLIWLDSETKEAMTERFKEVAKRLGIKTDEQLDKIQSFTRSQIEEIYAALCEHPTILVFDNAEGYSDIKGKRDGIQHFLPPPMSSNSTFFGLRRKNRYKVIVTTRYRKGWDRISIYTDIIPLGNLSLNDCKCLIIGRLKMAEISDVGENWEMLADYYDYLPIAIESATGLISMLAARRLSGKSYTIMEFVEEFVTNKPLVSIEPDDENDAHRKVQSLWVKTFEKLESAYGASGTFAVHLLNVLAFFSSDGVRIEVFLYIMRRIDTVTDESAYERDHLEPGVEILTGLSLVQKRGKKLIVHRLIQENRMKHMISNGTGITYAEKLCHGLEKGTTWCIRDQVWAFGLNLQPFVNNEIIQEVLETKIELVTEFPFSSGVQIYEQIYERNRRKHGPYDTRTLSLLHSLVKHLSKFEHHDRAVRLLKTNFMAQIKDLGKDDERTIRTRNQLARQLKKQGRLIESSSLMQSDWDRQKAEFGPDDPRTLKTRNEIADQLRIQHKYSEWLNFMQSDWDRQQTAIGPDDPRTLKTRHDIIFQLRAENKYTECLTLLQSDWDRQKTALGPDDPRTLATRYEIAHQLRQQGQVTECLNLLQSEWDRQKSALDPDDRRTLKTLHDLVSLLSDQKKYTESLNLLQSEWDRQKSALGPDDPRTLETRDHIARHLPIQGQIDDSSTLLESDWERQKCALGPDDPRTLKTRNDLMSKFIIQNKYTECLNLLEIDWDRQKSVLGPDDARSLETRNKVAMQLFRLRKNAASLNLLESDWDRQKFLHGPDDPRTLETRNQLASMLWMQRKYTEYFNFLESDLDRQKSALGPHDPRTLETQNKIASHQGREME